MIIQLTEATPPQDTYHPSDSQGVNRPMATDLQRVDELYVISIKTVSDHWIPLLTVLKKRWRCPLCSASRNARCDPVDQWQTW